MEPGEELHIIVLGYGNDWEAGGGSFCSISDDSGEIALPVFTMVERACRWVADYYDTLEGHMYMLEALAEAETYLWALPALKEGWYALPVDSEKLLEAAARVGADYLVKDPKLRDGKLRGPQEVLRFD